MIALSFDASPYYFKMKRIARVTGATMYELGHHVMALLVKDAMKRTPPIGDTPKAKVVGEHRVFRDIADHLIAIPMDQAHQFSADWQAYNEGSPVGHLFKNKQGVVYGVDYDLLGTSEAIIAAEHKRLRSPETGRTTKAGTYSKNIGRWKFVNRVHAPAAMAEAYIKKIQGHVGKTKAGWLAALSYFCSQSRVRFPAGVDWVQRHGSMRGSYVANMSRRTGGGDLVAINSVPWVDRFSKLINFAVRTRQRDFERRFFEKRLLGAYRKARVT